MTPSSQAPLPPPDPTPSAPAATRLPPSVPARPPARTARHPMVPRANSKQGLFHAARARAGLERRRA